MGAPAVSPSSTAFDACQAGYFSSLLNGYLPKNATYRCRQSGGSGEIECAKVWKNDFRFVSYWEFASVFFFVMKTQANFLTSVKLETILASKLFKNCWAVGLTCDKSTSLQSLFMAISRSCHVHVRLWYSSVGITRLKLRTSMMLRSFSPCQGRKTIFSFNYCKMTQNTGDEECAYCGFFLARF